MNKILKQIFIKNGRIIKKQIKKNNNNKTNNNTNVKEIIKDTDRESIKIDLNNFNKFENKFSNISIKKNDNDKIHTLNIIT